MALTSRIGFVATLTVIAACSGEPRTNATGDSTAASAATSSLENPSAEALTVRAPDTVRVRFETSKGPFVVEAYRAWSPQGVDRFFQLVQMGFYDDVRFFRVIPGFMAQFGLHGNPRVTAAWQDRTIPDDTVKASNKRGILTFAMRGPNTRTTQLFINYRDNINLDQMGFSPIGAVMEGMAVVDSLFGGYGEGAPEGQGPEQGRASDEGNAYLQRTFPNLDYIVKATVIPR